MQKTEKQRNFKRRIDFNRRKSKETAPRAAEGSFEFVQAEKPRPKKYGAEEKLKIIVMGGNEEVGRNMTILEYGNDIIIIDLGLQFPEDDMPGIDYIIPNISYLKGKQQNIRGVFITHGHFDHIGAIPHIVPELGNPVIYSSDLTLAIIAKRQEDYKNGTNLRLQSVNTDDVIKAGAGTAHGGEKFRGLQLHFYAMIFFAQSNSFEHMVEFVKAMEFDPLMVEVLLNSVKLDGSGDYKFGFTVIAAVKAE